MVHRVRRSALLLVLALTLACCGGDPGTVPVPSERPADVAPSEPGAAPSKARQRRPAAAAPSHLSIPAIGLSTSLGRLGLNADGTVEVPVDAAMAGWFDLGTVPGRRGSAVILGHVDSLTGPAVFAELGTLRAGDRIGVGFPDDTVVTFEVQEVATFANADFPAQRVYAGSPDHSALNLDTCGGEYDRERGGYQANVVVFTTRVAT